MIKASEAKASYDALQLAADKYISERIEPKIREVMEYQQSITLTGLDRWYVGEIMPDAMTYAKGREVELTKKIISILRANGYDVDITTKGVSNEYRDGQAFFIIDWSEPK